MARRNDHSRDELRRMCLDAAERLLDESGLPGLSMRRIAQSIGYTHGTLYLIFKNLDGLLLELNGRTVDRLVDHLASAASASAPGRLRVLSLARAYLDFARHNTARWRLLFEHHPGAETPQPAGLSEQIAGGFRLVSRALSAVSDPVRPVDEEESASFWAAIHGITVLALDDKLIDGAGENLDPDALLRRTVNVFTAAEH